MLVYIYINIYIIYFVISLFQLKVISQAVFNKKINCVDDKKRTKSSEEFIQSLDKLMKTTSDLMNSLPLWKYFETKEWKEYVKNTDLFFKLN